MVVHVEHALAVVDGEQTAEQLQQQGLLNNHF